MMGLADDLVFWGSRDERKSNLMGGERKIKVHSKTSTISYWNNP